MTYKTLLFSLICLMATSLNAQELVNGRFDSLYIGGIDRIYGWMTSDGYFFRVGQVNDTAQALQADTVYSGVGFAFSEMVQSVYVEYQDTLNWFGIKLTNFPNRRKEDGSHFPTFLIHGERLATDSTGYPDYFRSGNPFAFRPDSIVGYYRYSDSLSAIDNFGRMVLSLSLYDSTAQQRDTIAYLDSQLDLNPTPNWTRFALAIPYESSLTPDQLGLAFLPSTQGEAFGVLWLDELEFTYGATTSNTPILQGDIFLYPNPSHDLIRLNLPAELVGKISVRDFTGKEVMHDTPSQMIDISSLSSGTYLMEISLKDGRTYHRKFVKSE
ncbi:MAG: T9SS type A sorting domain-containing protein [Bacteroidota bacterium]